MHDRVAAIQRILDCSGSLFHQMDPGRDRAWQSIDLTMPQFKALICIARNHGATSSQIAKSLGVGLSTVTGIVDRLAEQDFVTRREDPVDRRITRVTPTATGQMLVDGVLRDRNELIGSILGRLDDDQLETVEHAFAYLIEAASELARQRRAEEVVA
jgi:DNA-binding MarR family transcriptional regulator